MSVDSDNLAKVSEMFLLDDVVAAAELLDLVTEKIEKSSDDPEKKIRVFRCLFLILQKTIQHAETR